MSVSGHMFPGQLLQLAVERAHIELDGKHVVPAILGDDLCGVGLRLGSRPHRPGLTTPIVFARRGFRCSSHRWRPAREQPLLRGRVRRSGVVPSRPGGCGLLGRPYRPGRSHHEPLLTYDIIGRVADLVNVATPMDAELGQHLAITSRVTLLLAQRPH